MRARIEPAQYPLAVLCAGLFCVLTSEVAAPIAPFDVPAAKRLHKSAEPTIAETVSASSPETFDDIENRLVFNPARQRTVATGGTIGSGQSNPSGIVLVGVILDGARRVAVVRRAGETTARRFGEGGTIGEWTLKTIEPDRVVVQSGATTQQIFFAAHPPQ